MGLMKKIFGDYSSRELKSIYPIVDKIEPMADEYKAMSDEALRAKTTEFKERLQNGETLDDILPEAFATVREAADRVLGMRPYRVQLVGGIVLHQGRIAELKTGEGQGPPLPGPEGGPERPRPDHQGAAGRLRRGHHLWHQQRDGLRLSAGQHVHLLHGAGAAGS